MSKGLAFSVCSRIQGKGTQVSSLGKLVSSQNLANISARGPGQFLDLHAGGVLHFHGQRHTSTTYSVTGPQLTAQREVLGGLVLCLRQETNSGVLLQAKLHLVSTLRAAPTMCKGSIHLVLGSFRSVRCHWPRGTGTGHRHARQPNRT